MQLTETARARAAWIAQPRALVCLLALAVFGVEGASAQTPAPPAPFTTAQADSGRVVFERSCMSCHGEDLSGVAAPPLTGASFAYTWDGKMVGQLMSFVQSSMPITNPGTVDEASVVRVVAYLLSANGMEPVGRALTRSTTGVVTVSPARDP